MDVSPETYRQIKRLFNQIIDLAPPERATALAQIDPQLRDEVAALLEESEGHAPFLTEPAVGWEFRMRTHLAAMRHTTSSDTGTV